MNKQNDDVLAMNAEEVTSFLGEIFPQVDLTDYTIDGLKPGVLVLRLKVGDHHLRPGGTVSGPSMFSLADLSAYFLILAHIGKEALAVTTSLNINFLNKPAPGDLISTCSFLKKGKRLVVCDIAITSPTTDDLVAHATATYSIPPKKSG